MTPRRLRVVDRVKQTLLAFARLIRPKRTTVIAKVFVFYSGLGDSILVQIGREWGLVDCFLTKSSGSYYRVREVLRRNRVRRLAFVCLTHPDRDHYFGLRRLLEEFFIVDGEPAFRFWDCGCAVPLFQAVACRLGAREVSKELGELYDWLRPMRSKIGYRSVQSGYVFEMKSGTEVVALSPEPFRVADFNEWRVRDILGLQKEQFEARRRTANETSVVLVIRDSKSSLNVVLGGDAVASVWADALDRWREQAGQEKHFVFVKVSHHGAKDALYEGLFHEFCHGEKTVAAITNPPADLNHPHIAVLEYLRACGVRVHATCVPARERSQSESLFFVGESHISYQSNESSSANGCADLEVEVLSSGEVKVTPEDSTI